MKLYGNAVQKATAKEDTAIKNYCEQTYFIDDLKVLSRFTPIDSWD